MPAGFPQSRQCDRGCGARNLPMARALGRSETAEQSKCAFIGRAAALPESNYWAPLWRGHSINQYLNLSRVPRHGPRVHVA